MGRPDQNRSAPVLPKGLGAIVGPCALAWVVLVVGFSPGAKAENPPPEAQVKASYLFHFLHFVDWPPGDNGLPTDRWVLGVVGSDRFGGLLNAIEAERVRGLPVEVRHFRSIDDAHGCHVLFVGRMSASAQRRLLDRVRKTPILTVGEDEGFLEDGGVIRFIEVDHRIRFRVHPEAAARRDLKLGAQLLELGSR